MGLDAAEQTARGDQLYAWRVSVSTQKSREIEVEACLVILCDRLSGIPHLLLFIYTYSRRLNVSW